MEAFKNDIIHNVTKDSSDQDIEAIVNAHAEEDTGSIANLEQITEAFSPDGTVQDIVKRLEASDTEFAGKTLKRLSGLSPLSLAVVFEQIKRGQHMELKEVYEMEYKIFQGFMD